MQYNYFLENIEREIENVLKDPSIKNDLLNHCIKINLNQRDIQNIKNPISDIIKRGGKRIRPLISALLSLSLGEENSDIYKVSAILELVHSGSLIIDDIEDNSKMRRGERAIHLIYGIDNSINSANFLYFIPLKFLKQTKLSEKEKYLIYEIFYSTLCALHLGQGLDITWHNNDYIPKREEYFSMIALKTGSLFGMGASFAAILSKNLHLKESLFSSFEKLGLYFQIKDDIKNITVGINGKEFADDLLEGKKSLPIIIYRERYPNESSLLQDLKDIKEKVEEREILIERVVKKLQMKELLNEYEEITNNIFKEFLAEFEKFELKVNYKNLLLNIFKSI